MTKRNKELREIYLLAAEAVASVDHRIYACNQIDQVTGQVFSEARQLFRALYKPEHGLTVFWLDTEMPRAEQRENCILALLFMAELARTDSLPTLSEIQPA